MTKAGWGDHYLQALSKDVRKWGDPNSNPVITGEWEEDFDKRCSVIPFAGFKPTSADWPLIIGDIVSNYRAALNYAAYELVRAGRTPSRCDERGVQFPIVVPDEHPSAAAFLGRRIHKRNLPGVACKHLRVISPFQPYPGRRRGRWPLDALRVLSNGDKHRHPLLTAQVARIVGVVSEPRKDGMGAPFMPFKVKPLTGRFAPKPGTHIARLDWAPGFHPTRRGSDLNPFVSNQPDVGVNLQIAARVTLEDYGAREVLVTLEGISDVVWQILRKLGSV
jgi:hypothetical protein